MEADVEFRCLRALTTAWEIYAYEQHIKFLHMVLECQGETYANAALEPLGTSIRELAKRSEGELKDHMGFSIAAYSHDEVSFDLGATQVDILDSIPRTYFYSPTSDFTADDRL
jgi:hypothetical protein